MDRSQFTFYRSYWEAVKRLRKPMDRLSALEAIAAYALDGEERDLTDSAAAIFVLIRPVLDSAAKKSKGGKASPSNEEDVGKMIASNEEDVGNKKKKEKEGEKEKENECYARARARAFVPPTLDEVKAYVAERCSPVDPVAFYDYFTAGKWKDSKGNPVRNWKQKLLTWESHEPKRQQAPKSFADMWREMDDES